MNVATALVDPRVREGKLYFRARDFGAHEEDETAIFRLFSDSAQELLGAGTWTTLQKLEQADPPYRWKPDWVAIGGKCSVDWLPEDAEFVEPTLEMP
jgi:hypothetical protein